MVATSNEKVQPGYATKRQKARKMGSLAEEEEAGGHWEEEVRATAFPGVCLRRK